MLFRSKPRDISGIQSKSFHANVFFHRNRQTMQRAYGLLVFRKIVIQKIGAGQGSLWEELCHTIGLLRSLAQENGICRFINTSFCARPARRKNAFVTVVAVTLPDASKSKRTSVGSSVIRTSSGSRATLGMPMTFLGSCAGVSGIDGWTRVRLASL